MLQYLAHMGEGMSDFFFFFAFEKRKTHNQNQVLSHAATTWKQMNQILWNSQLLSVILGSEI